MAQETREAASAGKSKQAAGKNGAPEELDIDALLAEQAAEDEGLDKFEKVRTEVDAFYAPEIEVPIPGMKDAKRTIQCTLRAIPASVHRRPPDPSEPEKGGGIYYRCIVTAKTMIARNDKQEVVQLKQGQVVWVDERYDFRMMRNCLPHDENGKLVGGEIYAKPLERINLKKGGRKKWRFDLRARMVDQNELASWGLGKVGSFNNIKALPAPAEVEGEEIPFG